MSYEQEARDYARAVKARGADLIRRGYAPYEALEEAGRQIQMERQRLVRPGASQEERER